MPDQFDSPPEKTPKPMQTVLLKDYKLPAGSERLFDAMHVPYLTIGVRVISSDEIIVNIEEYDGTEWLVRDTTPTIAGETVCNHGLKYPDFRVRVANPSDTDRTVSVFVTWMAQVEAERRPSHVPEEDD